MAEPNKELLLAVLIDADNASPKPIKQVMEEISNYGIPIYKRIYGDWSSPHLKGWKDVLNEHAIIPVQQFAYTTGKNSTDSALIIDAMDLLHGGNVDGFVIVSSDSDFTKLSTRLREGRKKVYGIGEKKTPTSFRNACDKFVFVEVLAPPPPSSGRTSGKLQHTPPVQGPDEELRRLVTTTIQDMTDDSGWIALGGLGTGLLKKQPEFDARNYGYKRLSDLMRALPYVAVETREMSSGNKHDYVRLK
ncbi:MAG: NYN domain-containing protein [Flavobacteriales bacterium]|nr:NYN domain-containing protein [Flavobacteriales bacterium]